MGIRVRFAPSGHSVEVAPGTTLLDAARQVGLPVASACGADGICGRCGMEVLRSAAALPPETAREAAVKQRNRVSATLRLACMVAPEAEIEVTAPYW